MCRAILASKEPEQVADDLAAIIPHDEALPDILIVEDGPDTEQAGPSDELSQQAASDNALALDEDMFGAAADSAAVVSYEAPQQTDVEYELAAGSPAYALRQDIADSAMEDSHMDTGNELMTTEMWRKPAIDEHAEEAHQADEHTFEHAESAQEPSDALAAEVAAVTDELVDIAIAEDQAVTAQLPPAEEEAVGAALEATLEGLVSTAEAGKPDQLSAENLQTDAENVAAADFGNSEEAVDAEDTSVAEQQDLANSILSEPSTVDSQVTAGEGDGMEQGPTTDAAVNVSELQPAVQEDVQMPVTNSEEALTEEQQGNFAQAATSRAPILMPVNGAEDAASPYAAADTGAVSTPEASLHEPSYADAIFPDTYTLAPGSDTDGLAAGSDTNTLATASDTEDAASPDAAADTKHDAPGASPLLKPSQEEMPSEAAALVTHDSVQVNLTLVSSSTVYSPAEEAEPAGARISANPQPIEDNGTKA
ncbi:g4014 [Coccomyxa viridis]|uniref:G4014 protein n=1 Tax=Coccomyxa viridis TaxID=1274662 RepID=A0ABP1FP99_9CHLO